MRHARQTDLNRVDGQTERLDRQAYKEAVIEGLKASARAIVETFPDCEVVLHDFADLQRSIVWIEGDVTGRRVGDCLTDLGLAKIRAGDFQDDLNYAGFTEDGRPLKSSSVFLRYPDGEVFGALCINVDVTVPQAFGGLLQRFLNRPHSPRLEETFSGEVERILDGMIAELTYHLGRPVSELAREERVQLVGQLDERGAFRFRRAVPLVASRLGVSRHTIYNDLNEVRSQDGAEGG